LRHGGFVMRRHQFDGSEIFKQDASFWPCPALTGANGHLSYKSSNYPDRFICHRGFRLLIEPSEGSDLHRNDASFHLEAAPVLAAVRPGDGVTLVSQNYPDKRWNVRNDEEVGIDDSAYSRIRVVPALTGDAGAVSFEDASQPGSYLRHAGFVMRRHQFDGSELFKQDASFWPCPALTGANGHLSYKSSNYPDRFICHRGFRLLIEPSEGSDLHRNDASFQVVAPGGGGWKLVA